MNFFNIDMHISIIHDVKHIFKNLGHNIDSVCMSGHTWVNGEKQSSTDIITPQNWKEIDSDMCDIFYHRYKADLEKYDGFIHSYPPAFALLFERFNKPIITIACTRFEYPIRESKSKWLIYGLERLHRNGQLIPIANNLVDKAYCEKYTKMQWTHISSLCDYMDAKWTYKPDGKFAVWSRSNFQLPFPEIDQSFSIGNPYNRKEVIEKYNGIIHIPYNLSIMSAFEQYYSNIPMFVPSIECMKSWIKQDRLLLSELMFPNSYLTFEKEWLKLADWYDPKNMPSALQFNSDEDLQVKLSKCNLQLFSDRMRAENVLRKVDVYNAWNKVLEKVK